MILFLLRPAKAQVRTKSTCRCSRKSVTKTPSMQSTSRRTFLCWSRAEMVRLTPLPKAPTTAVQSKAPKTRPSKRPRKSSRALYATTLAKLTFGRAIWLSCRTIMRFWALMRTRISRRSSRGPSKAWASTWKRLESGSSTSILRQHSSIWASASCYAMWPCKHLLSTSASSAKSK